MTVTQSLEEQIQECERSIQEQQAHLAELKAAAERAQLGAEVSKLPEGSLAWVSAQRDWIEQDSGCIRCGNPTVAFDHETGWDSPSEQELMQMSPEELAEELPALVERLNEMESLMDESALCSYCQHMADKDD